jgi:heavy metal sensor kinase
MDPHTSRLSSAAAIASEEAVARPSSAAGEPAAGDATDAAAATAGPAATAPATGPPAQQRSPRSLRFRLTFYFAGLLACTAGILLLFVNAAAHLATIPIERVYVADPVNGVVSQQFVDTAQANAQAETLARLRVFSIVGFVAIVIGGVVIGWIIAGRALNPLTAMAGVARRITGRNLKERIVLEHPDDELRQLANAFNDMVDRLDDAFERQRQFVGDASHELRTPLTALQLSLDSVRSDTAANIDEYRAVANEAAEATTRMRRLVEDLLALVDSEQPHPHGLVALSPLVDAVIEEMEALAKQRGVMLGSAVPAGLVAVGDQLSLRRALTNLVENAIRYNGDGGHVMVEQSAAPPGWVALAVRDDGIGIDSEALPHIFDRFYRVERGRSRADGGSGLGLSIVAKIAAEHGGRVDVASTPGEGSRFVLTLRSTPAAA